METNKKRAAKSTEAHIRRLENMDIEYCNLKELILNEELMLMGVGEVLNEFGCTPGDAEGEKYQQIKVSGIALWMLGKVVAQTREEILRKLAIAGVQYQAAGVREILEVRMKRGRKGNAGPTVGE